MKRRFKYYVSILIAVVIFSLALLLTGYSYSRNGGIIPNPEGPMDLGNAFEALPTSVLWPFLVLVGIALIIEFVILISQKN